MSPKDRSSSSQAPSGSGGSRPNYMTVGDGVTSESASRLAAMLDEDSGYGGSMQDGDGFDPIWHDNVPYDHPIPRGNNGEERKAVASHIHQLFYNQNKTVLARAISRTVEALKRLQEMNAKWPAHYPSVQRPTSSSQGRPGLKTANTTFQTDGDVERSSAPSPQLRRAITSVGEQSSQAESSSTGGQRPTVEPRLVTPQLSQDFSILKIDLKMGHASQAEVVHSLEKTSISALLDGQITKTIRHLFAIRDRIDDTSSKVLVTGDLNAGKSTFCNALLRRKVLPEDQQPCTSIFCEVLDFRENGCVEEVHAVPQGKTYHRDDQRTYQIFALTELEKIVTDNDKWCQCKIYIKDKRSVDESLLSNGVVNIALIDAPGLNHDSVITTANFAKQEEIDVVIFVVSAANHFTQSATEFVFNAAREKAYIFMVVNAFDSIRDKNRCQEMILNQVRKLSPATFKESSELVHFVSSNVIPVAPAELVGGGSGSASGSSSGFGDPDGDDEDPNDADEKDDKKPVDKGKGKEKEKIQDFEDLEAALRRFVLEKRSRSKLAPAKTYLLNLLGDLTNLGNVNVDVAEGELERMEQELKELEPKLEESRLANKEATDDTDRATEDTVTEVYNYTRATLNLCIDGMATREHDIVYPGVFQAYQYAEELRDIMLQELADTVHTCEDFGREKTTFGVNYIKSLGLRHLGDSFPSFSYRPENMFKRRRDALARNVDVQVELADFFYLPSLWEVNEGKVAGAGMALTVASVGTKFVGGAQWFDGTIGALRIVGTENLKRLFIPGVILAAAVATHYLLATIPSSLPRRLSAKLRAQLSDLDYTHSNATRISTEVRRALTFPAAELRSGLQRSVEGLAERKKKTKGVQSEAKVARGYFGTLVREAGEIAEGVRRCDLEGGPVAMLD